MGGVQGSQAQEAPGEQQELHDHHERRRRRRLCPTPSSCKGMCCWASVCAAPPTPSSVASGESGPSSSARLLEMGKLAGRSAHKDVGVFTKGEFILPGSEAQLALAQRMRDQLAAGSADRRAPMGTLAPGEGEHECVVCLGEFGPEDPEVLTLCSCGINKTAFHYACLLGWLERHTYCPACRGELYFEEHSAAATAAAATSAAAVAAAAGVRP